MKKIQMIKKQLEEYMEELDVSVQQTEKNLRRVPEGKLILSRSNGSEQYYHKIEQGQKKGTYIPTNNRNLAEALAQKDYDISLLKTLHRHKHQISRAIRTLPNEEIEDVYSKLPEARKKLIKTHTLTDEQYVEEWLKVSYSGKSFDSENTEIFTELGERVRSKSEKILADKFYTLGIPYRYEYPLKIKGYGLVYPDFVLLNITKRTEFYFEHFGMMDNPMYCQNAIKKIESYIKNHIYPGKNLLFTFETSQKPLDMRVVEQMLREYLLQ